MEGGGGGGEAERSIRGGSGTALSGLGTLFWLSSLILVLTFLCLGFMGGPCALRKAIERGLNLPLILVIFGGVPRIDLDFLSDRVECEGALEDDLSEEGSVGLDWVEASENVGGGSGEEVCDEASDAVEDGTAEEGAAGEDCEALEKDIVDGESVCTDASLQSEGRGVGEVIVVEFTMIFSIFEFRASSWEESFSSSWWS